MGDTWKNKNIIKNGQYFKSYVFLGTVTVRWAANISDFNACPQGV